LTPVIFFSEARVQGLFRRPMPSVRVLDSTAHGRQNTDAR
jgi:hypothetical protein